MKCVPACSDDRCIFLFIFISTDHDTFVFLIDVACQTSVARCSQTFLVWPGIEIFPSLYFQNLYTVLHVFRLFGEFVLHLFIFNTLCISTSMSRHHFENLYFPCCSEERGTEITFCTRQDWSKIPSGEPGIIL